MAGPTTSTTTTKGISSSNPPSLLCWIRYFQYRIWILVPQVRYQYCRYDTMSTNADVNESYRQKY